MTTEIYEVPDNLTRLFQDVLDGSGHTSYQIINYTDGMDMDNNESMSHFLETVDIPEDAIVEDEGTQVVLSHPDYEKKIVIDSGGLGDFFSHGFDCQWAEESEETIVV